MTRRRGSRKRTGAIENIFMVIYTAFIVVVGGGMGILPLLYVWLLVTAVVGAAWCAGGIINEWVRRESGRGKRE